MEFGQNVHKIIENILRKIMAGARIEEIDVKREVDNAWKASSVRSLSTDDKFKNAALTQIESFINASKGYLTKECVFSSEDTFNISVEGNLVTGRFDAVFQKNGQFEIVDFKTGDPKDYSAQLSFYGVCFKQKYENENDIQLKVYYLKSGKYETVKGNDPSIEIASIVSTAQQIRNRNFSAKPSKFCGDCAFNKICPSKK